jgi:predicted permease
MIPFFSRRREAELDEEIRIHLEMAVEQRVARGESREKAARAARREFGDVSRVKEVTRSTWPWRRLDELLQDISYAARFLARRPFFSLVAIGSLAIGTGANATIFAVIQKMILLPPPGVAAPDRVVEVGRTDGGRGFDTFSYVDLEALRNGPHPFTQVAGWRLQPVGYAAAGGGRVLQAMLVSHEYFPTLGVTMQSGRSFAPDEDRPGVAAHVAVLSHAFWRDELGSDPDVVGKTVRLNRLPFEVIGVASSEFLGQVPALAPELYVPLTAFADLTAIPETDWFTGPTTTWLFALARLEPGASETEADIAVAAIMARQAELREEPLDPENVRSGRVLALGAIPAPARGPAGTFLGLIAGLMGVVLLVAAANVAGMLLALTASREKELAIRLALGSGRWRLARQLVTECMALFLIAGIAGLAFTWMATRSLMSIELPLPFPIELDLSPDWRVISFGVGLSVLVGVLFGLPPALYPTRWRPANALTARASGVTPAAGRLRRLFIAAQVGLTVILLTAGGLFVRALGRAGSIDVGFDATGVKTLAVDLSIDGYDEQSGRAMMASMLDRMRATPGIREAAFARDLPLDFGEVGTVVYVDGFTERTGRPGLFTGLNVVSDGYFEAVSIPLLRGRTFEPSDGADAPSVVVVSLEFAEQVWPGREAMGQSVRLGRDDAPAATVIGVVANSKNQFVMEEGAPMIYAPAAQRYSPGGYLVVRGDVTGASMLGAMRALDPTLALGPVQDLSAINALGVLPQRAGAWVTASLGLFALILSSLGLYGALAFSVTQRTNEIGVRVALGAHRPQIVRLVLSGGTRLVLPGLAVGLLGALAVGQVMRGFILGVPGADPVTFVLVPATVATFVVLACAAPAYSAARLQPSSALRRE